MDDRKMHALNLSSTFIAKVSGFLLGASTPLILSSMAFAAIPINDTELTNNFLSNDVSISKIASAQLVQNDYLNQELERKQLKNIAAKSSVIPDNLESTVEKSFVLVGSDGAMDASEPSNINDVKKTIANVVKAKKIANSIDTLDNNERKTILISNEPLFALDILKEIALKDTSSDLYRIDGKKTISYDLSTVNGYYYNNSTGSYEFNNVTGIVELYVELYDDDRGYNFRRLNYVF